jgi:hypothetical protein
MREAAWLRWRGPGVSGAFVAVGYVIFSLGDMTLSSIAFVIGVPEANPVLAALADWGLFVPVKVGLTVVVAGLIGWLYPRGQCRGVAWLAVLAMAGVNLYHLWGLSRLSL